MAHKQFVIAYQDHSKSNISRSERDRLLLSRLIEPIEANQYRYIGKAYSCRTLADLAQLKQTYFKPIDDTGFLEGNFVIERDGKRTRDIQAKPGQLELQWRLQSQPLSA